MTEQEAYLVLNAVPNLWSPNIRRLVAYFGSAREVLKVSREEIKSSGLLSYALEQNLFNFSKDKFLASEYNLIQHKGIAVLTAADDLFPSSFKESQEAPVVLYVKGTIKSLESAAIAIVGSRAASYYGLKSARIFARSFVEENLTVVSGLARGIDTAAHQGALESEGCTVAVIGCGFNFVYPQENRPLIEKIVAGGGAVVSEYAFDMPPLKHNFPWRNRIISFLSLTTVVIEAGRKSGALITADYALSQNKEVFVLPSNIDADTALGSNQLIQDGARIALRPDDVLMEVKTDFSPLVASQQQPILLLSDEQTKVFDQIDYDPVHIDELSRRSGVNITSLMNITLSLELKRAIRQLPGQFYVRTVEHA